jgi:hypothetical protein
MTMSLVKRKRCSLGMYNRLDPRRLGLSRIVVPVSRALQGPVDGRSVEHALDRLQDLLLADADLEGHLQTPG